ncbi:hypothetical protein T09_8077 [Trichinella sp. T9]|nr:hypothetical protein T09_8077 [Trichinella sp. T9]
MNAIDQPLHEKRYFYDITQHAHVHIKKAQLNNFLESICETQVKDAKVIKNNVDVAKLERPCSDLALEYTVLQRIINFRSSLFCDSSTFRFVHISPSAPMIISGAITLVTVFQFIEIL